MIYVFMNLLIVKILTASLKGGGIFQGTGKSEQGMLGRIHKQNP
jgi:hypothetical protein